MSSNQAYLSAQFDLGDRRLSEDLDALLEELPSLFKSLTDAKSSSNYYRIDALRRLIRALTVREYMLVERFHALEVLHQAVAGGS